MKHEDATAQLAFQIARAKRALAAERLGPAILPILLIAGAWAAASLFGLQDRFPPLIGSLAAIFILLGLIWAAVRQVRAWRAPSVQDARARLAVDAGLDPGALDALEDHPSQLDPVGLALWAREQERARTAALQATAKPARVNWKRVDPFRVRYVVALAVVAGVVVAGGNTPDRLARAFLPDPGPLLGDGPIEIEAWAAPAGYTGAAPVSLTDRIGERVDTPPSVEATVRVTGPVGAPTLLFEGSGVRREVKFVKAADGAYEAKLVLPGAGVLKIVRFHTKARWNIRPAKDLPPTATFKDLPKPNKEAIAFGWAAEDDYGVRGLVLRVRPVKPPPGLVDADPVDTPIEGPAADPKKTDGEEEINLVDHPYAGMEVEVRVVALDATGQEGESAPARVKLPEKIFLQPLARAAIEIRKAIMLERRAYAAAKKLRKDDVPSELMGFDIVYGTQGIPIKTDEYDPRIERAPAAIKRAGKMIDALTSEPGDGYFQDPAVFIGYRGARAVLDDAREIDETSEAADILWKTAMRAEYGDAADARRALQEAQRALSEAISRGADQQEISRLSDAVRQAMNNYMQALVQEAQREGESQENQEDTREKTQLSQNDIEELLKEVERLAQSGKQQEAQALLERLAQLLDNLEVRLANGQGEGGDQEQDAELNDSVEGLSDAIGKQRALRDDTQREGEEQGGPSEGQELAQRQEQLREQLGEAEKKAQSGGAEKSDELAKAGSAMDEAEDALKRGDFGGAQRAQDEALRKLRAGAEQLSKEIMRREEKRNGAQKGASKERDPLGRSIGGLNSEGDEVSVPDAMDRQRAREILDDIRKRAQDPRRPEGERDYLRRLLDRFTGS